MKTLRGKYLLLTAGLMVGVSSLAVQAQTPSTENLSISGLKEPVQIIKDKWGIPHIYAKNESDLFFAQGYNIAHDRLFQLEMWRRQATGTVAEILGPNELNRDIANRLFTYRGDMKTELNWYHPHGTEIFQSFVDGINAYIDETQKNPSLLTAEFKILNFKPGKWTTHDVISRFNALGVDNVTAELKRARAIKEVGADKVKDLEGFQPGNPDLTIDQAIDVKLLTDDILTYPKAFGKPLEITPDEVPAQYRKTKTAELDNMNQQIQVASAPPYNPNPRQDMGSNNWVVSGKLTMTGYPIVVGDPHRNQSSPSLRYWVHLNAPGWNVIGVSEPAVPGVSIGHNDYGGWQLTVFGSDSEDLYVYDTNPSNPDQYKYKDGWESMKVIHETFNVKGQGSHAVDLKYTRHGPVIWEDKAHHKAYAARAAWLEPGNAQYLANLRSDQAKNWQEFDDAMSYSRLPAENMVWGDKNGDIGYQAVGIAPLRPNWSALVPVPGDGRYEWNGFLPIKELPHALNPAKGYYNTSNNFQLPTDNIADMATIWPKPEALHYAWTDPYRAQSVAEVLGSGRKFAVADMEQLQNNDFSIPARSLVPLLRDLPISDAATQKAANMLLHWNYVLDKDSVEAGIYEMFQRHLMTNVRDIEVPAAARADIPNVPLVRIIAFVMAPDGSFGPDPLEGRNAVLVKSLNQAVADLTKKFGSDMSKWNLGAYHYARIYHPMGDALNAEWEQKFDVGHAPRGGDGYTITATGGSDNQTGGGAYKSIFDTENWDNSVGLNNPGQSGDINSPHYRDLYELWSKGKYFPIFFTKSKIESVAEKTIDMTPK